MDIIIGSGNNRKKVTFSSGTAMKKMHRERPGDYFEARNTIVTLMQNQKS